MDMDYLDRVFVEVKALKPGRYPLDHLREPARFIEAVKELMDGQWLCDLHFSEDYRILVIQDSIESFRKPKRKDSRAKRPNSPNKMTN